MPKYKLNEDFISVSPNFGSSQGPVTQNFSKDDIVDGEIIQAGTITTTFRGFAPQGVIGNAFFPIPLSKVTKVDDSTPVKVKVLTNENINKKYAFLKDFYQVKGDINLPEMIYTAKFLAGDVIISNRKDTLPTDGGDVETAITYVYPQNTNVVFKIPERLLTTNVPNIAKERITNPITKSVRAGTRIPRPPSSTPNTCQQKYDRMALPQVVRSEKYWKEDKNRFIISCECEKEADGRMAAIMFTSGTDLKKVKEGMIESCLKSKTPAKTSPKQGTGQKSNIDTQTVALVLGVIVVAYFLTK